MIIAHGGLRVFPRLVAAEHSRSFGRSQLDTGIGALDALLGGGVASGSSTLVIGPSGVGKSLLLIHFLAQAVARGERVAMFVFDEDVGLLIDRVARLGIDLAKMRESGLLHLVQVQAAELSPGEFAGHVRAQVEAHDARTVIIDSLNGYQQAIPDEQFLLLHMHELLMYLSRSGVSSFITVAQHGMIGQMQAPIEITYIADTVLLLRFFESRGEVLRAVSVIKKRTGSHENTIRQLCIGDSGVELGPPLTNFQGVLRGVPTLVPDAQE
jgi:circadian clock protein KaiC